MSDNARFALVLVLVLVLVGGFLWFLYGGDEPSAVPPQTASHAQADEVTEQPFEPATIEEPRETTQAPEVKPSVRRGAGERQKPRAQRPTGNGSIRGEVTWRKDDGPAAGAEVTVEFYDWDATATEPGREKVTWSATTDDDGKFEIPRLPFREVFTNKPAQYAVTATKDGAFGMSNVGLTDDEPDGYVEIELDDVGTIAGRVTNTAGDPVADAFVFPESGEDGVHVDGTALRVLSDSEGRFELIHLPVAKWKVTVKAKGYAVKVTEPVAIDSRDVEIVLTAGGSVSGHVIMAQTGDPVADANVTLDGDTGRWNRNRTTSDSEGAFEIAALADGNYGIDLDDPDRIVVGESPRIKIEHENAVDDVKLLVAVGGVITGRAYDADTLEPIPDVRIADRYRGGSGRSADDGVSDADGYYRITGLAEGSHTLRRRWKVGYLHGEQREDKTVSLTLGQQVDGIDFPIRKGLYLRGIVVDTQGNPVERVDVTSEDMTGVGEGESTASKRDGTFEHRGFSEGTRVMIHARREGFSAQPVGPLTIGTNGLEDVKVVMEPGASIAGIVVDKTGKPVGSVYVSAQSQTYGAGDSTDRDGTFKVEGLAAGTYNMMLRRNTSGYRPEARAGDPVTVAKGQALTGVRLVLDEKQGLTISGRVMNSKREPLKDAHVNAHSRTGGNSYGYAQTDETGAYEIAGLSEGAHQIYVSHNDYSQQSLEEVAAGSRNVNFTLEDQATVEGRVVDARNGRPIATFQLGYFNGISDRVHPNMYQNATTYFDENGYFKLSRVSAGDVTVFARAEGHALAMEALPGVRPGQSVTGVEIRLDAGASARGVVVDSRGVPVAGAQVFGGEVPRDEWSRQNSSGSTTDSNGAFELTSLGPEVTVIGAYHSKYPVANVEVALAPGQTIQLEIVMSDGGSIEGTVRIGGKPATGHVFCHRSDGGQGQNATADANGYYSLGGLADGDYMVSASVQLPGGGNRSGSQQATVQVGMVTEVNFDFTPGDGTIEGVVTLDGAPVTDGSVMAMVSQGDAMEQVGSQLGSDGSYRLEGIPAGPVNLMLGVRSGESWLSRSVQVEAVSGKVVRRDIDLSAGVRAAGTVSGQNQGDAVFVIAVRGEIQITEMSQNFWMDLRDAIAAQAQVTASGGFEMTGLDAGTYTFVAVNIGNPQSGNASVENARYTTMVRTIGVENETLDLRIP